MAILRGFPPSNTISPSVRITEKDLSFIAPIQTFHRAGLVGFASKGPINIPTVISTNRQLHTIFGNPHPDVSDPYLVYAAEQYLLIANELYIVRVAVTDEVSDEKATIAEIDVPVAGTNIKVIAENTGNYDFSNLQAPVYFRWRVNGIEMEKVLVIDPESSDFDTFSSAVSATVLADYLNAQLVPDDLDGIVFGATAGNKLYVQTTYAYGLGSSLEFVSVKTGHEGTVTTPVSMYSIIGFASGNTEAVTTGTEYDYPNINSALHNEGWDFSGFTGADLELHIVVDGTNSSLIDNVVQTYYLDDSITYTTESLVLAINNAINSPLVYPDQNLVGGFVASGTTGSPITFTTLHAGRDARILVKTDTAAAVALGFTGVTGVGESLETSVNGSGEATDNTRGIILGADNDSSTNCFTITAESAGIDGNDTSVVISVDAQGYVRPDNTDPTTGSLITTFRMDVFSNGVQAESWGGLNKNPNSRYYVATYISLVSDYIRVIDNTATFSPPLPNDVAQTSTYALTGGTDGIPASPEDQDALLVGNAIDYSGMNAFSEPEQIDIDIIACPGHASTQVVLGLIDLAESRGDCIALIDPPFGLTVKEIIAWQNGQHPLNTTKLDSDFAALYWPWVKIYDTYNAVDVWVPPSGSVMAVYAHSDNLGAPWFAPAGTTRGLVPNITDVFNRPTQSERDSMYGNNNAINPIIQFPDLAGFMVWGQKTLQRRPTALDRVNVRRLMFVIEKRIRAACRDLLFEPNDAIFQKNFNTICSGILDEVKVGRGLYAYIIKDDAELNTPDVIDRNEFRARIGIQPTKAVEFIFIEFSIHRTGSFAQTSETF